MLLACIRRFTEAHRRLWCAAGIALLLLQPFIAVHFRCDGLEDEPELRVRNAGATTQFEADDRPDHAADRETTVFAQAPASIDLPHALSCALDTLLALLLALPPLVVALARPTAPATRDIPERVPHHSGAPPPAQSWRRLPPTTAPPFGDLRSGASRAGPPAARRARALLLRRKVIAMFPFSCSCDASRAAVRARGRP